MTSGNRGGWPGLCAASRRAGRPALGSHHLLTADCSPQPLPGAPVTAWAPLPGAADVHVSDILSGCPSGTSTTHVHPQPSLLLETSPHLLLGLRLKPQAGPGHPLTPCPLADALSSPAAHPGPRHSHPCPVQAPEAALGTRYPPGGSCSYGLHSVSIMGSQRTPRTTPSHPLAAPACPHFSPPVVLESPEHPERRSLVAHLSFLPPNPPVLPGDRGSQPEQPRGPVPQAFGFCLEASLWTHPVPWALALGAAVWTPQQTCSCLPSLTSCCTTGPELGNPTCRVQCPRAVVTEKTPCSPPLGQSGPYVVGPLPDTSLCLMPCFGVCVAGLLSIPAFQTIPAFLL